MSGPDARRSPEASWRLEVGGGRLDGACMSVPSGRRLSIGSAMTDDVVLRDPSVTPAHLALRVLDAGGDDVSIVLEDVLATVRVGDVEVGRGETVHLPLAPLRIGELVLTLRVEDRSAPAPAPAADEDDRLDVGTDADTGSDTDPGAAADVDPVAENAVDSDGPMPGEDDEAMSTPFAPTPAHRGRRPAGRERERWLRGGGLLLASVLLASVAVASLMTRDGDPSVAVAGPSVTEALAAASLPLVRIEERDGVSVAVGSVPTREDAMTLETILAAAPVPIDDRTVVVADLVEQVEDVFRVQGIEANARSADGVDIEVRTRTADLARLARVRDTVARDLPDVGELTVVNERPPAPPVREPPRASAPVKADGKRVAMIVSDPPAYVVTEDKSRYFVGALLPSGHRITAIENGRVSLVKDGRSTELDF